MLWQKLTSYRRATEVKLPPKEARKILGKSAFKTKVNIQDHTGGATFDSSPDLELYQAVIGKLNVFANKLFLIFCTLLESIFHVKVANLILFPSLKIS